LIPLQENELVNTVFAILKNGLKDNNTRIVNFWVVFEKQKLLFSVRARHPVFTFVNKSMETSTDKILVITDSSNIAQEIVSKITNQKLFANYSLTSGYQVPSIDRQIETKYYTANVKFLIVKIDNNILEDLEELQQTCDTLLIVFETPSIDSFNTITSWCSTNLNLQEGNFSTTLCISKSQNTNIEEVINEWCLENGSEYIAVDDKIQETNVQSNTPFEEKFGIDRIVEVLECNMWPSMVQKTESGRTKEITDSINQEKQSKTSTVLDTQINTFTKGLENFFASTMEEENDQEDESFSSFERTLSELSALRNSSKDLPDSERRELAAKVAETFLRFVDDE